MIDSRGGIARGSGDGIGVAPAGEYTGGVGVRGSVDQWVSQRGREKCSADFTDSR